jgi:hypothetical protein
MLHLGIADTDVVDKPVQIFESEVRSDISKDTDDYRFHI